MTDITIDAGVLLFATEDPLAAQGLLVPFGVEARSNLGRFTVDPGTFDIPTDFTGMGINKEHQRERVVGGITRVWEQPEGVLLAMRFADTPEGRKAAEDARSGRRRNLSVEVSDVKIRDGKAVSGRIFGASVVEKPAFAGATLLAAEDTHDTDEPTLDERVNALEAKVATMTTDPASAEEEEPEEPAEEEEGNMPEATQPATLTATGTPTAAEALAATTTPTVPTTLLATHAEQAAQSTQLSDVYSAFDAYRKTRGEGDARTLLAALTDLKTTGAGTITVGGSPVQVDWVGRLFQGKRYVRKYITLGKLGTQISLGGKKGYKLHRGTSASPVEHFLNDWAGNKAEINSGNGWTESAASTRDNYAFGNDIAREFFDLPGGEEVIEGFFELIREDYLIWSDAKALAQFITTAGTPVAPATYPTEYDSAIGMLIDGIFQVAKVAEPSFAIVNESAFRSLLFTPKDLVPEYVSIDVNTDGTAMADGKVHVVYAPDAAFNPGTLVEPGTDAVLVGAREAVEFDELGSTPLTIDALEVAKGGVDRAVHGYVQKFPVFPEGVKLIATANVP